MAHLGRELFSRYLFAVEIGGTLLLVALVGAVAILAEAARQMPPAPKTAPAAARSADRQFARSARHGSARTPRRARPSAGGDAWMKWRCCKII